MKKHFTLVEILAVVFLIGILTAIGFGVYSYAMNSAKEGATKGLLARLEAALESCNTKFGYYPPGNAVNQFNELIFVTDSSSQITEIRFGGRTFQKSVAADEPYLKEFLRVIDAENLKRFLDPTSNTSVYELKDAWGNLIFYAYPGKFNTTSYDLYSAGADGRIGEDNDALSKSNLNGTNINKLKDSSTKQALSDDLFNF